MSESDEDDSAALIAAGSVDTARIGNEILQMGGNAVDAAVGATFAACVAEPILTSVFGGGFATLGGKGHASTAYDFFADVPGRGVAALSQEGKDALEFGGVDVDFGATTQTFHIGRGAVAVPLLLPGLLELHQAHGRLSLKDILAPSIRLAKTGFVLGAMMGAFFQVLKPILIHTPEVRALFAPKGTLLNVGDHFINPDLGSFLERLSEGEHDGAKEELLANFSSAQGLLTSDDFAQRKVITRTPLAVEFAGYEVLLNPPPSSGGLLIAFGLALLNKVDVSVWEDELATCMHLMAAMAITNLARADSLDRAVDAGENIDVVAARFLSETHVESWRVVFNKAVVEGPPDDGFERVDLGSTTHISVVDSDGFACAITTSNGEGCGYVVPGTGSMANNFMGEEDLHPAGFHSRPAGERLTSMMCPTIVLKEGVPVLVLGTGGSNRIRTAILQVLVRHLLAGWEIERAVDAPRLHYEGRCLYVERQGFGAELSAHTLAGLSQKSHESVLFDAPNMYFGGVHAAASGGAGAGDKRRGGVVATTPKKKL